jgi:sulfide:quinone oxidoreductase
VRALDPARKVAVLDDDTELPFDLYLGVPVHRVPAVVEDSGMCVDGWIPVNSLTLETSFPGVYAVGDVTSVGTPKAGVFAEGQAAVVADRIIAQHRAIDADDYDGRGICYIEFGSGEVGRVEMTFVSGETPVGVFGAPSVGYTADKFAFGSDRIRRWFGREWTNF